MKRWIFALSLTAALCISAAATYAGPACCKSKKTTDDAAKVTTVAAGESSCSQKTACKAGAFPSIERKFVVAGEIYDSEADAWAGLASASESYVERFTTIACVVDGKVVYCDEKDADKCAKSGSSIKAKLASTKSGCCGSAAKKTGADDCAGSAVVARLASALKSCNDSKAAEATKIAVVSTNSKDEPECCKAKLACCEKAKAEGKKGNCCAGEEKVAAAKLASASSTCSKAAKTSCSSTKLASAKSGCCKSKQAAEKTKLVSDTSDDKACCKAKLASADGDDKACCKAKLASATSTCSKSKAASCDKTKLASAKSGCSKSKSDAETTKLASASGCSKSKEAAEKTKLVSAEGCCKSKAAAEKTKLVSADGCCKSKAAQTKLVEGKACCDGENIIYRVAGRDFAKWDDAIAARDAARGAIKKVGMSYLVNGEKVSCSTKVCPKAKAAGKVKFVVGETTTGCELHARVELAKAQIEAVSKALAGEKVATR